MIEGKNQKVVGLAEFLEGPTDEDEAWTEVPNFIFPRSRTRPRFKKFYFRGRGRGPRLALIPRQFRGQNEGHKHP